MDSSKLAIKFFIGGPAQPAAKDFVPVFHSWIQTHAIGHHLLIDVADYAHVAGGPGAALISHEATFSTDLDGGLGLMYVRKTPLEGDFEQRFRQVLRFTLQACLKLEENPALGGMRFQTDRLMFQINDRLLAPNTGATFGEVRPGMEKVLSQLYGGPVQLRRNPDPANLFEILVTAPSAPTVGKLLEKLGPG